MQLDDSIFGLPATPQANARLGHSIARASQRFENYVGFVYLAVALPIVIAGCIFVPPMQVPDEPAHFFRAAQLASGEIGTAATLEIVGGHVDKAIAQYTDHFCPGSSQSLAYCSNIFDKAGLDSAVTNAAKEIPWQNKSMLVPFQTTVRYPPMFYVPQVVGLTVARWLNLGMHTSFILARLLNGAAAVALTAWALQVSRRAKLLLFIAALLPMTLFEMASVSQDALLLAFSFAVVGQSTWSGRGSKHNFWLLALGILALSISRPPLVALCLLLLQPGWRSSKAVGWKDVLLAAGGIVAATIFWMVYSNIGTLQAGAPPVFSTRAQTAYLASNPMAFFQVLSHSWRELHGIWYASTIGLLGWANIALSAQAYDVSRVLLTLGFVTCALEAAALSNVDRFLVTAAALGSTFLIFLATYLTWNSVGHPRIEGLQGRYIIGLFPLLALALPSARRVTVGWAVLRSLLGVTCLLLLSFILCEAYRSTHGAFRQFDPAVWKLAGA